MPLADILALSVEELVYSLFFPFILFFAIFFGILSALKLFHSKVNIVLSLVLTFVAAYGGAFAWLSQYIVLGPYVALTAFILVFVFGTIVWALGRGKEIYYETGEPLKKMEKLYKKRDELVEKYDRANPREREGILEQIREIEREIDHLKIRARFR